MELVQDGKHCTANFRFPYAQKIIGQLSNYRICKEYSVYLSQVAGSFHNIVLFCLLQPKSELLWKNQVLDPLTGGKLRANLA
jgi:hypothetical protein